MIGKETKRLHLGPGDFLRQHQESAITATTVVAGGVLGFLIEDRTGVFRNLILPAVNNFVGQIKGVPLP